MSRNLAIICFRAVLFVLAISLCSAQAESFSARPLSPAAALPERAQIAFSLASQAIEQKQLGEAAENLDALRGMVREQGYEAAPEYSAQLIDLAYLSSERPLRRYLLTHALRLSPSEPSVLLSASLINDALPIGERVNHFLSAAGNIWTHPTTWWALVRNILLVTIVSLTVSMFVVSIVQLVSHRGILLHRVSTLVPVSVRGVAGVVLLLFIITAPLFAGVLFAICAWSLVLSRVVPSCRWLSALAGALTLAWLPILIISARVDRTLNSPQLNFIEAIQTKTYYASNYSFAASSPKAELSPEAMFSLAQLYVNASDYARANHYLDRIEQSSVLPSSVAAARDSLGAALLYHEENFSEAKRLALKALESGEPSSDLYYLLSLISSAQFELDAQRDYYLAAREISDTRVLELEGLSGDLHKALNFDLSLGKRFESILQGQLVPFSPGAQSEMAQVTQVSSTLFGMSHPLSLVILGLVTGILGVLFRFKEKLIGKNQRDLLEQEHGLPSLIWICFPGGYFVRGKLTGLGVVVIGSLLACILVAWDRPVVSLDVLAGNVDLSVYCIVFAISVIFATVIGSLLLHPFKQRKARVGEL